MKVKSSPDDLLFYYPPRAFFFTVKFIGSSVYDTSFQEVSGIESEMETESYREGGENQFIHNLPKGVKHTNLVLKRAIAPSTSPLVKWCIEVLDGELHKPIETKGLMVKLLNDTSTPIRSWSFQNAYPVKWSIDTFNSTKNELAIETIELSYSSSRRTKHENTGQGGIGG